MAGSLHSWASCVTDKAAAFFSGFRPTTGFGGCFDEQTLKKRRNHRSEIERDVVSSGGDREFRQSLTECSVDSGSVAAVRGHFTDFEAAHESIEYGQTGNTIQYCTSIDIAHWRWACQRKFGWALPWQRGFHMEIPPQLVATDITSCQIIKDHLSSSNTPHPNLRLSNFPSFLQHALSLASMCGSAPT